MAGSNESSVATIGVRPVTQFIPQLESVAKPAAEVKSQEVKKAEQIDQRITASDAVSDKLQAEARRQAETKRFYDVKFDSSINRLFTEVTDSVTKDVVLRIPAGIDYSKDSYRIVRNEEYPEE